MRAERRKALRTVKRPARGRRGRALVEVGSGEEGQRRTEHKDLEDEKSPSHAVVRQWPSLTSTFVRSVCERERANEKSSAPHCRRITTEPT